VRHARPTKKYCNNSPCILSLFHFIIVTSAPQDIVIGKSRSLEVRQLQTSSSSSSSTGDNTSTAAAVIDSTSPFPIVLHAPINGRITSINALHIDSHPTALLFITTAEQQYAVIGFNPKLTPHCIQTYAAGNLKDEWNQLGSMAECGPIVTVDPHSRCIVLHLYDGLVTVFPVLRSSGTSRMKLLGPVFHARLEERTVLAMTMLHHADPVTTPPHLCLLHQDSRGAQHVVTHVVDLAGHQVLSVNQMSLQQQQQQQQSSSSSSSNRNQISPNSCEWLKKSRIDGGSSLLIPVPPRRAAAAASAKAASASSASSRSSFAQSGGVVVLGQRQITYCSVNHYKVMPIPQALILSWDFLPSDASGMPRFLLGDEFGNLHMLTLITNAGVATTATATTTTTGAPQPPPSSSSSSASGNKVIALQLDTLGACTLSSSLQYLDQGLVFCGSTLGDSQLVQIHDEPIPVDEDDIDDGDAALELGETTYLSVLEEYVNLGPIVDFDLVPMAGGGYDGKIPSQQTNAAASSSGGGGGGFAGSSSSSSMNDVVGGAGGQSQVVTASGSSKFGSLRIIRNGIGMKEFASVELPGIQNMWCLRSTYGDMHDAYLVQSFVGETRVLGVVSSSSDSSQNNNNDHDAVMEDAVDDAKMGGDDEDGEDDDVGGTLAEVVLPGLEPNASTLHVCNIVGDLFLQITESHLRLINTQGELLSSIEPEKNMTVASANEAGQVVVALIGGKVLYFEVENNTLVQRSSKQMDREVSCLDINPFVPKNHIPSSEMEVSEKSVDLTIRPAASKANMCAVGLWDDFTVRLLTLEDNELSQLLEVHLSAYDDEEGNDGMEGQRRNRNNTMARSLCLITLDYSSTGGPSTSYSPVGRTNHASPGVDMLFVGLGDGTLISFVVKSAEKVSVQSKKEVSLGTQRIKLIPLTNGSGATCLLATGDRPTIVYLTGVGGGSGRANYNPKLCYSNVNLSHEEEGDETDISRPHGHESISVNVAARFSSPLLFDEMGNAQYSLCVADDANLRLGIIDDIQKLHVTTCRLDMAPRRVVHCAEGRMLAVGCMESGIKEIGVEGGGVSMGNCIRFLDDSSFDDIHRIDLEPTELVLSMLHVNLRTRQPPTSAGTPAANASDDDDDDGRDTEVETKSYLVVGTAYALHDEDEPTRGRILVYSCDREENTMDGTSSRSVRSVTELQVRGGVYSMCQFYEGTMLATVNSKTQICHLTNDGTGVFKLSMIGVGHHGHILSLFVSSRAPKGLIAPTKLPAMESVVDSNSDKTNKKNAKEMLAVVGDLMRSISLVQYYPEHSTLEEVARDFNANWTTAVTMLTDDVYLGGENWNNLFVLRRNTKAKNEEVRCRLDTVGEFHLGEMCNKFMNGSLVMPNTSNDSSKVVSSEHSRRRSLTSPQKSPKKRDDGKAKAATSSPAQGGRTSTVGVKRPMITIGSQTLFGTVDGTLGVILGLDGPTTAFFSCLEKALESVIVPVGNFSHQQFRAFNADGRFHPSHGFVDGDLVESFLDLDKATMELVVQQMNKDGTWDTTNDTFKSSPSSSNEDAATDMAVLTVADVLSVVEEMTMLH
jgi:DNA damage-binding protein 1